MAASNYNCDVSQGFNFQKDQQTVVGHIDTLTIGDIEFKADLNVADPLNSTERIKVVAVASYIEWQGGYADAIVFSGQVSTENKKDAVLLQHKDLANTAVEVNFTIYDYDPDAKKYYQAFYTDDTALEGLVQKTGSELVLQISSDQSMEVASPKNYVFSLGVMPNEVEQAIQMAVSDTDKFAKSWGVSVEA
jgi:hypothetical protein